MATAQDCHDLTTGGSLLVVGNGEDWEDDGIYCICGARGKVTDDEPTAGGSYLYVCSRTGAVLGYSGI
jgi:hypothetical protein